MKIKNDLKPYIIMLIVTITVAVACLLGLIVANYNASNPRVKKMAAETKAANIVNTDITIPNTLRRDIFTRPVTETTTVVTSTTIPSKTTERKTTTTTTETTTTLTTTTVTIMPEPIDIITYYYYDNWTWIGDSRTVGLSQCVDINSFAKSAMGLNWFIENSETIYDFRYQTIIINLGINDLGNVYNYIDAFNNMPTEFTENNCIYIMSINPVDEVKEQSYGYSTQNSSIEWFNDTLRDNLRNDFFFIDTYSYLYNDGFDTIDGLHYDYNTYIKIYNYMIDTIIGN